VRRLPRPSAKLPKRLWKCSWPNGSFSIVLARTKADVVFLLDEFDSADESMVTEVRHFVIDFNFNEEAARASAAMRGEERDEVDRYSMLHFQFCERTAEQLLPWPSEVVAHIDAHKRTLEEHAARPRKPTPEELLIFKATEETRGGPALPAPPKPDRSKN